MVVGLPDSDDPNFLPYGCLTFLDALTFGSRFYVDTSHIGEKYGRGDRAWDFWEIDFPTELRHVFTPDEFGCLPTDIELGAGYRYEYHPPRTAIRTGWFDHFVKMPAAEFESFVDVAKGQIAVGDLHGLLYETLYALYAKVSPTWRIRCEADAKRNIDEPLFAKL